MSDDELPRVVHLTLTRAEAIAVNNAIALAGATMDKQLDSMVMAVRILHASNSVEQLAELAERMDAVMSRSYPELVKL